MTLTEKQIEAAVAWWAAAIQNPTFSTLRPEERGRPDSEAAATAEVLATSMAKPIAPEAVERFKAELRAALRARGDLRLYAATIMVDYGPDRILYDAAVKAGIKGAGMLVFPWKTVMRFDDGGVQVACGYGRPFEELLPRESSRG